jgi:hypothetical protein
MAVSKWVGALGVMVLAVFGVTFVVNYVGPAPEADSTSDASAAELPVVNIRIKKYPFVAEYGGILIGPYEWEHRKPGYQDYWFANENDAKVRIGAVSKSCKCQGVEVFVLPEGHKARLPYLPANPVVAAAMGLLGRSAYQTYVEDYNANKGQDALAETVVTLNPDDPAAEAVVPPNRVGWVRMKWTAEKAGQMNLTATLWMDHPGGVEETLERQINFVDPVNVAGSDSSLASLRLQDLPRDVSFYVWSSTRKSFTITKAEVVRDAGLPAQSDAFVVGTPVPLTNEQCSSVASALRSTRVLSAYRVPVTLQKKAADGTLFDIGNFRRRIDVVTDAFDKVLGWTFSGLVRGDMRITGVDDAGGVSFGSFRRDNVPPPRYAFIQSDIPDLKLELDEKRVPQYLQARLSKESDTGGQPDAWKLEIRVLPGAYGRFPRDDDPVYRDSAIYIRTAGSPPQCIRVLVRGDAGSG